MPIAEEDRESWNVALSIHGRPLEQNARFDINKSLLEAPFSLKSPCCKAVIQDTGEEIFVHAFGSVNGAVLSPMARRAFQDEQGRWIINKDDLFCSNCNFHNKGVCKGDRGLRHGSLLELQFCVEIVSNNNILARKDRHLLSPVGFNQDIYPALYSVLFESAVTTLRNKSWLDIACASHSFVLKETAFRSRPGSHFDHVREDVVRERMARAAAAFSQREEEELESFEMRQQILRLRSAHEDHVIHIRQLEDASERLLREQEQLRQGRDNDADQMHQMRQELEQLRDSRGNLEALVNRLHGKQHEMLGTIHHLERQRDSMLHEINHLSRSGVGKSSDLSDNRRTNSAQYNKRRWAP